MPIELRTRRLRLFVPTVADAERSLAFLRANYEHVQRWRPHLDLAEIDLERMREIRRTTENEARAGTSLRFALTLHDEGNDAPIAGYVVLSDIRQRPFKDALISYEVARDREGRGLVSEAVREVSRFAFETLDLHRIVAWHMPQNERSQRVLERCGFATEGVVRKALLINGAWRDHVMCALVNPQHAEAGRGDRGSHEGIA